MTADLLDNGTKESWRPRFRRSEAGSESSIQGLHKCSESPAVDPSPNVTRWRALYAAFPELLFEVEIIVQIT